MHTTTTALEDVGVYTLSQLAERTGVPLVTIKSWVRHKWLPVVKIDGFNRSTEHMVKLAAKQAQEDGRGRPRGWELAPAEEGEPVAV